MEHETTAKTAPQQPDMLSHVPIEITVSVGRARPLVRDLLNIQKDMVLLLDKHLDDPVELYVGDRLIAIGTLEAQVQDGRERLSVRLSEVLAITPGG